MEEGRSKTILLGTICGNEYMTDILDNFLINLENFEQFETSAWSHGQLPNLQEVCYV